MFAKLKLQNFKSIGKAEFDLGKINVLTGQSNLGKSNVVQAIYCLVHNHWDSNYMKWGEKKCTITLTDENGEWVEYRHNETSAEYRLSTIDQPFTKIGRDVPQPVREFLKMNCVQFDEDLSLDFNFERQFDPSFVISLSGFELAKVFGKLMNLDIVLSAARNINKDLVGIRKSVDGQEAIENVSIEYIQSHYPIELKYALLHKAIQIDAKAEALDAENKVLCGVLSDIEYYSSCAKVYSEFLDSERAKQIDSIHEPVQGLDAVISSVIVAENAQERYSKALRDKMPDFDFEGLYGLVNALVGQAVDSEKVGLYSNVLDKVDSVDVGVLDAISGMDTVLGCIAQWDVELEHENNAMGMAENKISVKTKEFNDYLVTNNVCPISGKPFMDGCVESILANA